MQRTARIFSWVNQQPVSTQRSQSDAFPSPFFVTFRQTNLTMAVEQRLLTQRRRILTRIVQRAMKRDGKCFDASPVWHSRCRTKGNRTWRTGLLPLCELYTAVRTITGERDLERAANTRRTGSTARYNYGSESTHPRCLLNPCYRSAIDDRWMTRGKTLQLHRCGIRWVVIVVVIGIGMQSSE